MTSRAPISAEDYEVVYDELAAVIDRAQVGEQALLLTKLAMVLTYRLGNLDEFRECLRIAAQDISSELGGNGD